MVGRHSIAERPRGHRIAMRRTRESTPYHSYRLIEPAGGNLLPKVPVGIEGKTGREADM